MGLEIVSFTIRDIRDDRGYLDALGVKRTSEVKRDATIGEAEADRDAGIRSAEALRDREAARFAADTNIAESERGFSVQKANYDREVNARRAEADLADELQRAKTQQEIREEQIQIEVVERTKQIEVQQQEIARRERELEATIRKPAEAERYRLETIATGNRNAVVQQAEADAESIRLKGEADAEIIRIKGEAEADAIRAKGLAEADAMQTKAEAWKQYGEAAVVQQVLEALPQVAEAIAAPLAKTDRIVMIGGGGGGGGGGDGLVGPARLTRDISNAVAQVPEVIESLTGIDIVSSLKNLPGIESSKPSGNGGQPTDSGAAPADDVAPDSATDEPAEDEKTES